ncbi:DUF1826 domain-containing protein [Colwellia psychrerythraea]|uniref:Succinylglutamate desuccinylase n=1 Tax=Colwellia psychrerythraea TaxID=28229 RepID=A0A099KE89_COLPS|nr:DUF1826 domain-containing protein [Colwellia psychrerythraea]KGJ88352.1 protein of unknown function DUF1826 [Colwellia psychrerythraea]
MNTLAINHNISGKAQNHTDNDNHSLLFRRSVEGSTPDVLTDIYQDDVNIVTWQRNLENELTTAVGSFLEHNSTLASVLVVAPENCVEVLSEKFDKSDAITALIDDITLLVDMFCCLFELKGAGLRLTVLDRPMCPRFHVDRIPCRLVTTYHGTATQWLNNNIIERTKLGSGSQGKPDEQSGLMKNIDDINQLTQGDIALLKGENWDEQEGAGLVHRSPAVYQGERRLLLTLDFIND